MKKDKNIPQPVGNANLSEPFYFPRKEEICRRLDEFYRLSGIQKDVLPSSLFEGALYAMRKEHRENNPDWMAQVAHSLREIFYNLGLDYKSAFRRYGSTIDEKIGTQKVGEYKNFITKIAHHNFTEAKKSPLVGGSKNKPIDKITPEMFESVVLQFGDIIFAVLRRQIDAHQEIDEIFKKRPDDVFIDYLKDLIYLNPDTERYFFHKTDEKWLDWLWKNGFLEVIKQKAEDPTRYSYRTPELDYLVRIAEKVPEKVVNIMLEVPISKENFNPEVIDRFIQICSILPSDQLKRIVPKILEERWIPLMGVFNQWGFEYGRMFQRLKEAKDYESILTLAEAVLSVKTKDEIDDLTENPFYFNDLSYTKVSEGLVNISDEYLEKAFALSIKIMREVIISLGKQSDNKKVFEIKDGFLLFDVDLFSLEFGQEGYLSWRKNVHNLVAVIVNLAKRLINRECKQNKEKVKDIFDKYIGSFGDSNSLLPDSQLTWRLRLFILSLCPEAFKEELKRSFFRLFEVEKYYEIIRGAEYLEALRAGFDVLSDSDKRDYVKRAKEYFLRKSKEEKDKKENWHKVYGSSIFSMIANHLTEEEKREIEKEGFTINPDIQPEPSVKIRGVETGSVVLQAPLSYEEFKKLEVLVIAEKLRSEWSPEVLAKKYKDKTDFWHPINAEGIGEYIKKNIPERLQDYINNAEKFFDREKLDPHYTYSYFRGVQEVIKNNHELAVKINWDGLIKLFKLIKASGEEKSFEEPKRNQKLSDLLLANWNAVHSAMVDILQELLVERDGFVVIDFKKYREDILSVLQYLLSYPDPVPEDEKIETAKLKTKSSGDEDYMISDPFSIAINSVRGRAFEALVLFVYQDSKRFKKDDKIKIAEDVKAVYENVLKKENTRAIMFLFGYHLPSFYYRDKSWLKSLLTDIFPKEESKKYLYTAAWEGYLTQNLYREIFFDPNFQKLYERGIKLTENDFPPYQKHFKDPEKAIAVHLALAFGYFSDFSFNHNLFKAFWETNNLKSHKEFISFIGRHFLSNDYAGDEWFKKNNINKKKFAELWKWILDNVSEPQVLSGFGYWINPHKEILDDVFMMETISFVLEKTNGNIDWEYGLFKRLPIFAKKNKEKTLEIIHNYFLNSDERVNSQNVQRFPLYKEEIKEALSIIYKNGNQEIKHKVENLINTLIKEGSRIFWTLKEILDDH